MMCYYLNVQFQGQRVNEACIVCWECNLNQTRMTEQMQHAFERKILGRMYGPLQETRQRPL